jgi:hypothetical protein
MLADRGCTCPKRARLGAHGLNGVKILRVSIRFESSESRGSAPDILTWKLLSQNIV